MVSFKLDQTYPWVIEAESEDDLRTILQQNNAYILLGKGSNSLVDPKSQKPLVKLSPTFLGIKKEGTRLFIPSGIGVAKMMQFLVQHALSGLEFAAGVPAGMGGMIAMNFGCWGQAVSDRLIKATVMDEAGKVHEMAKKDLKFDYRTSRFQEEKWVALGAWFDLEPKASDKIKATIEANIAQRLAKQPLRQNTFGCIFKNLDSVHVGMLLDQMGYKGMSQGNLEVSSQHANFLINKGNATFDETQAFLENIKRDVKATHNITLEYEVKFLG